MALVPFIYDMMRGGWFGFMLLLLVAYPSNGKPN